MGSVSFNETGLPNSSAWGVTLQSGYRYGGASSEHQSESVGSNAALGPSAVLQTTHLGGEPIGVTVDTTNQAVYVTQSYANYLYEINATTGEIAGTVALGSGRIPLGITFDPLNDTVLVANYLGTNISVVEGGTASFAQSVSLGSSYNPEDVVYDSSNNEIYVTTAEGELFVLDASTYALISSISLASSSSFGLAVDSSDGHVYATIPAAEEVADIDPTTNHVVASIPVGVEPAGLAFDPATDSLFVANTLSNNLTIVNTSSDTVSGSVALTGEPSAVLYDPLNACVYVSESATSSLAIVDAESSTVLGSVPVGPRPEGLALVGSTGSIFAAYNPQNVIDGNVTALDGRATLHGRTIQFDVPVGPWKFRVTPKPTTYLAHPMKGHVHATLSGVTRDLAFRPIVQKVVFKRSGLQRGTLWGVNVTGPSNQSVTSTRGSITFFLVNGTYSFSIWNFSLAHPFPATGVVITTGRHRPLVIRVEYS